MYIFSIITSFLYVFIVFVCNGQTQASDTDGHEYSNEWAVEVRGGRAVAEEVARSRGMDFLGEVGTLPDFYLLRHRRIARRSADPSPNHHSLLEGDPRVLWTEQQVIKKRVKREISSIDTSFQDHSDPLWKDQWYLHSGGHQKSDMRVREAWAMGITGKNVVVTILDDGIEHNHRDLMRNYDPVASIDINGDDPDPMPRYDPYNENKHGTRCAGEVAAIADNDVCIVGVAYDAKIGGVRMLDGDVNDAVEAKSLSLQPQHVDIYSASWGPDDNGEVVDGPGKMARRSFEEGVTKGRGGKGSIFVWASGNGGRDFDSCACDGYTNSIYTLSVSSASQNGQKPWYLEECASTLATTYSSGRDRDEKKIVSTDLHGKCTTEHTGTSASAPLAAGLCALALEANPNLTWRDMQHIVVLTSNAAPLEGGATDWVTNAAGRRVSHVFGFGLMDAGAMVKLAKSWKTVPTQQIFISHYNQDEKTIPKDGKLVLETVIDTRNRIRYLEHVQAEVTLEFPDRGKLMIKLTSPQKTTSTLLPFRPRDRKKKLMAWLFLTVHCWGEDPNGKWTLEITHPQSKNIGTLTSWRLVLYGTKSDPLHALGGDDNDRSIVMEEDEHHIQLRGGETSPSPLVSSDVTSGATSGVSVLPTEVSSPSCHSECLDRCHDSSASGCYACKHVRLGDKGPCVSNCGVNHFTRNSTVEGRNFSICYGCHYSCATCRGPNQNDCLECPDNSFLDQYQQCMPCAAPCRNCSGSPTMCTSCIESYYLSDNDCVSREFDSCPQGTYLDLSRSGASLGGAGPGECLSCHGSCSGCTGPMANDCLSCSKNRLLQNRTTCVANCDKGFYASRGHCLPCSQSPIPCVSCSGPRARDCTQCPKGWKLIQQGCVALECGSGQFLDPLQGGICSACHSSCLTCKGPQFVDCLSCPDATVLHKGKCLQKCPKSTYLRPNKNECNECHPSCMECAFPGSDSDCTSCYNGHMLLGDRGVCFPGECGIGFYKLEKGGCKKCDISCLTCKGPGPGNCVTCQPGPFALHRPTSKCIPCCDPKSSDKDACCVCKKSREKVLVCVDDIEMKTESYAVSTSVFADLVTILVVLIIVLPLLVFLLLQSWSHGWLCFGVHRYAPLDQEAGTGVRVRGLNSIDKITLTEEDLRDEDEFSDDLYVAPHYTDETPGHSPKRNSGFNKDDVGKFSNGSSRQLESPVNPPSSFHVPLLDKPSSDLQYT